VTNVLPLLSALSGTDGAGATAPRSRRYVGRFIGASLLLPIALGSCRTSSPRSVRVKSADDCPSLQGIHGILRDQNLDPVRDVGVVAEWTTMLTRFSGNRPFSWSPEGGSAKTDVNGVFSIPCLEPGTYRLSAWFCDWGKALGDAEPSDKTIELRLPFVRQNSDSANFDSKCPGR